MRTEAGAAAVSFVGGDITDEDVFAALGPSDLGVRVGEGKTSAKRRLRVPVYRTDVRPSAQRQHLTTRVPQRARFTAPARRTPVPPARYRRRRSVR